MINLKRFNKLKVSTQIHVNLLLIIGDHVLILFDQFVYPDNNVPFFKCQCIMIWMALVVLMPDDNEID